MIEEYLKLLNGIKIEEFPDICLEKVLFNECFYVNSKSVISSVKRVLFSIFEMNCKTIYSGGECTLLLISRDFHRNDHNSYWRQIKSLFNDYNELSVNYLEGNQRLKQINILNLFKNTSIFFRIYFKLSGFKNIIHRSYLSSVLTDIYNFKANCLDKIVPPKVVMTFFDADPLESFAMQYFANKGSITITNQHGYPIYRSCSNDLLNQSQIINLSSTYYLAKGEFTKKQFVAAGFDDNRIKVVGSLQDKKAYRNCEKDCFALFLDTPALEFGNDANLKMIQLALDVSKVTSFSFVVKMHPVDKNRELYEHLLDGSLGNVVSQGTTNEEICFDIDFGIIHASSIYIDLIMQGIKMYKLEIGYNFPLVESKDDIICSAEELVYKYGCWLEKSFDARSRYITVLQDYYSVNNARNNIKEFVEKFQ